MSLLFLTDIIKRAELDPKKVKLIRNASADKVFKQYFEMDDFADYEGKLIIEWGKSARS